MVRRITQDGPGLQIQLGQQMAYVIEGFLDGLIGWETWAVEFIW